MGRRGAARNSNSHHHGVDPKAHESGSRKKSGVGNNNSNMNSISSTFLEPLSESQLPNNLTSNSTGSTSMSSRQEWAKAVAPSGPVSPRLPIPTSPTAALLSSPRNRAEDPHLQLASPSQAQSKGGAIINPPVLHRQHSREDGGGASGPFSPRNALGSTQVPPTSPFNRLTSSSQGEAVVTSLQEIFRAVQSTLPKVESAFATCHGGADFVDDYFSSIMDGANNNSADDDNDNDEEEMQQMRRLGSWSTVETMATAATLSDLGPSFSASGPPMDGTSGGVEGLRDDDGHLIDPMLLERRRKAKIEGKKAAAAAAAAATAASSSADPSSDQSKYSGKASTASTAVKPRRRRVVQFEYPPVSSLRQCPRVDPGDLPNLFFTEEELEVFEHDRESTYTADDIEIVAISENNSPTSTSYSHHRQRNGDGGAGVDDDVNNYDGGGDVREPPNGFGGGGGSHPPSSPMMNRTSSSSGGGGFGGLGSYISTPRVMWNKKRQAQAKGGGDDAALLRSTASKGQQGLSSPTAAGRAAGGLSGALSGLPPSAATAPLPSPGRNPRPERLIKSVQIFLRERSAG